MARPGYDTPAVFRGGVAMQDVRVAEFRVGRQNTEIGMDDYDSPHMSPAVQEFMAHYGLLGTVELSTDTDSNESSGDYL